MPRAAGTGFRALAGIRSGLARHFLGRHLLFHAVVSDRVPVAVIGAAANVFFISLNLEKSGEIS